MTRGKSRRIKERTRLASKCKSLSFRESENNKAKSHMANFRR
ncbi:20396_t:CDS:1, partial [Gigaspora margarita]